MTLHRVKAALRYQDAWSADGDGQMAAVGDDPFWPSAPRV